MGQGVGREGRGRVSGRGGLCFRSELSWGALDHDRLGPGQRRQLGWGKGWRLNPGPCGLGTELGGRGGVPMR